jgi:hypothetical protein
MAYAEELEREALRVYERYVIEVVEAYDLCPWAASARRDGHVRELVILRENSAVPRKSAAAIASLVDDPVIEVALLIYPDLELGRLEFDGFVRALRDLDAERHEIGAIPFAMAAFHPDAAPDLREAERLIPFLRRTPDPTVQLLRRTALDRVRGKSPQGTEFVDIHLLAPEALQKSEPPSLRKRIAQTNLETVEAVGIRELEAIFTDIRRDRCESYARLGGP